MGILKQNTLFGMRDMVAEAVTRIRGYEALAGPEGYALGFSGGKDSVVIFELCKMSSVKFTAIHSLTTIDPPEVVDFVRQTSGVTIAKPKKSFFQLLVEKGIPPLRHRRWCCEELKENRNGRNLVITGIRWSESHRRTKRKLLDTCYRGKGQRLLNPIIDWSDEQVWEFIHSRNLRYLRNPKAPASPLREEYEKLRDKGDEAKDLRLAAITLEYTRKKELLLTENVADKARARATRMGRFPKRLLFGAIHKKHRSRLDLLLAETKKARKEVYDEFPSQTWVQWLQEQAKEGRAEAVEALRGRAFTLARKTGAALRGEKPADPEVLVDQKVDGVTKLGTVIYDLGADAVRDDCESFRIGVGATPDTDIMALKLAQRRFGNTIHVDGDRAFRERMIAAAVEGKVYIKFGDPMMERKRNELFRIRYRERKERESMERRSENGPGRDAPSTKQASPPRFTDGAVKHDDGHAADKRPDIAMNCPDCGKPMRYITHSRGDFFGCTGYPGCKKVVRAKDGKPADEKPGPRASEKHKCLICGQGLVRRPAKKDGEFFWGCSGYPACRNTYPDHHGKPQFATAKSKETK